MRAWASIAGLALVAILVAAPARAEPGVTVLGGGAAGGDPVAACGALASSPWEADRIGPGLEDDQLFLGGALTACETALAATPQSVPVQTWLGRTYLLVGRAAEARRLLEPASAAGSAHAMFLLADLLNRQQIETDRALELLNAAAEAGYPPALASLAARFETGQDGEYDRSRALQLYQLASDAGYGLGSFKLGEAYQYGYEHAVDYDAARRQFELAASQGEPLGYTGLGQMQEFGQGGAVDYARAAGFYQRAADGHEKMGLTALAYLYEMGLGVPQDYDRSFALLVEAAAQRWAYAQAALSIHYLFGQGTAVDEAKAFALAISAAQQHVAYASGVLGYMFKEGLGTDRNLSAALFHFTDGANNGDQYSADQLEPLGIEIACQDAAASQYEPGVSGSGRDFEAIDADAAIAACAAALEVNPESIGDGVWLARAYARAGRFEAALPLLEQGVADENVLAETVLGDLLMAGDGLAADPARAVSLYRAAAEALFAPADYALGLALAEGRGVDADPEAAERHLRLALGAGIDSAQAALDRLGGPAVVMPVDLSGFGREGPRY
jgi:TPR repeat protein